MRISSLVVFIFASYAGVNIGGAGSYVYEAPVNKDPAPATVDSAPKPEEKRATRPPSKGTNRIRLNSLKLCVTLGNCWGQWTQSFPQQQARGHNQTHSLNLCCSLLSSVQWEQQNGVKESWVSVAFSVFSFQLEASPPFLGRQTCAPSVIRESTLVGFSVSGKLVTCSLALSNRNLNKASLCPGSREGDVSGEGLASAMSALWEVQQDPGCWESCRGEEKISKDRADKPIVSSLHFPLLTVWLCRSRIIRKVPWEDIFDTKVQI